MIWLEHPNFPEYEISENGQVRRIKDSIRFKAGTTHKGRILKSGYRQFHLIDKNKKKRGIRANRLVAEAFLGPAPSATHHAAHNDGNKLNNQYQNLRWATSLENHTDRIKHGTILRGSKVKTARLDEEKIREIRTMWSGKRGELIAFARKYHVGTTTIRRVITHTTWNHVGEFTT